MSEKKPESESESKSMKLSSEEASREFKALVSPDDLQSLNHLQHTVLGRLQDSNAVLSHFNDFSQHCFSEISGDMARNTRILKSVKSDLDYIFQKLSYCGTGADTRKVQHLMEVKALSVNCSIALLIQYWPHARSMKTKILATYPDAFPEDSTSDVIDMRPDLEMPK